MRRCLALAFALVAGLVALAVPAAAQTPSVRLTLISQTPWNGRRSPIVDVRVRAENTGTVAVGHLSLGVTLWGPVNSRTEYEESLSADPVNGTAIWADTTSRSGALDPGAVREFDVRVDLTQAQLSQTFSLIYPLKIDLRTRFTTLAALRTPVIYLVRKPVTPLDLAWTFVLHAPVAVGADGTFRSDALETSLGPGGQLAGEIAAIAEAASRRVPVDVVVSPTLLLQLAEMRDGYTLQAAGTSRSVDPGHGGAALAAQTLSRLRAIAASPTVELSSLPYAEPRLPALVASGLARDIGVQLQLGRQEVASVLGRQPDPSLLRPPQSMLDGDTAQELGDQGVDLLVLDPGTVPPPEQPQGFAPPPTASIAGAGSSGSITAVVADPSVTELLTTLPLADDPALGAQSVLGELASIWQQEPGTERGIDVTFPEGLQAPGAFYRAIIDGITGAPWLRKRSATALAASFPPPDRPADVVPWSGSFTPAYVDAIKQARRQVGIFRSMLVQPSEGPDRLDHLLLLAEAGQFVTNEPAGFAFITRVRDEIGAVFSAIQPPPGQLFTLTSTEGHGIPVAVRNGADVPLKVTVRLSSPHLRVPVQRTQVLDPGTSKTIPFDVDLTGTGRFLIQEEVLSPSGRVIGATTILVRSTAYNRIALLITIGAALLALLVWARRFVPRRTS